jgi:hypothetical protein
MNKEEALAYLIEIDFATRDGVTNQEVHAALLAESEKRADVPKEKTERKPRAVKEKAEPTMEGIQAKIAAKKSIPKSTLTKAEVQEQLANIEDAPF